MKIHPHEDLLLEYLLQGEGLPFHVRQHVAECASCRSKLRLLNEQRHSPLTQQVGSVLPWVRLSVDYSSVLESTARGIERRRSDFARERADATALLAELVNHPPERREVILRNSPRFQTWGLYERLVDGARDFLPTEPCKAEELARLALCASAVLDTNRYHVGLIEDLRARAWSYLANSRRIRSDLRQAEEAFGRAFKHLRRGTREPLERALLLDLKASLLIDQRRFQEALRLLRRAAAIFKNIGEEHRAGRSLVKMSTVHYHAGDPETGIPLLREALELIDPEDEPRLLLCAWHNLVFYYAEAGRFMEAQGLYIKVRPLYTQFPDSWTQSRRRWVQGKIARGLGQITEAEEHFLAAREGFVAEGIPYDTALVSLELASLYAEQGRTAELKSIAEEMLPIFSARHILRETIAAQFFLRWAASADKVHPELADIR